MSIPRDTSACSGCGGQPGRQRRAYASQTVLRIPAHGPSGSCSSRPACPSACATAVSTLSAPASGSSPLPLHWRRRRSSCLPPSVIPLKITSRHDCVGGACCSARAPTSSKRAWPDSTTMPCLRSAARGGSTKDASASSRVLTLSSATKPRWPSLSPALHLSVRLPVRGAASESTYRCQRSSGAVAPRGLAKRRGAVTSFSQAASPPCTKSCRHTTRSPRRKCSR